METNVGRDGRRSNTVTEKPVSGGEGEIVYCVVTFVPDWISSCL